MLSACAAKKIPVENIMTNLKLVAVVDDEHSILKKEPRKIDFNKKVSSSLSVGESIVRIGNNISYYQVFEGKGEFSGIIQFQLNSYCACWGFDKKIMIPLILLLDSDGNEIKEGDNIERALKKYKRKFEKTKTLRELRDRQYHIKPTVINREISKKAVYVEKLKKSLEGND